MKRLASLNDFNRAARGGTSEHKEALRDLKSVRKNSGHRAGFRNRAKKQKHVAREALVIFLFRSCYSRGGSFFSRATDREFTQVMRFNSI